MGMINKAVVASAAFAVVFASFSLASQPRNGGALGARNEARSLMGQLKPYPSTYYTIYTDLEDQDVKETVLRMTKMAEEYHERTKTLFKGRINGKLPFFLYANGADYYKAGGMQGSAGVFNGEALMAMTIRNKEGRVGPGTWHVVQHEGFHQFVDAVIKGPIPTWANEGLAEYFGESLFTGDGMVTGLIPAGRLARLKQEMNAPGFKSIKEIMNMSHAEWNSALGSKDNGGSGAGANYDTAWAMVHFLAHAENGKYQDAFASFLVQMGNGKNWERAWAASFGGDDGFEKKWREYWLTMPDNPTADLYAKAVVSTLTSFLGRAASQKQTFETFEAFIATDAKDLKANPADWLPPALYSDMKALVTPLRQEGCVFTLTQAKNAPPVLVCTLADGGKLTGTCSYGGGRFTKMKVDFVKAPAAATHAPAKPAPPAKP